MNGILFCVLIYWVCMTIILLKVTANKYGKLIPADFFCAIILVPIVTLGTPFLVFIYLIHLIYLASLIVTKTRRGMNDLTPSIINKQIGEIREKSAANVIHKLITETDQ